MNTEAPGSSKSNTVKQNMTSDLSGSVRRLCNVFDKETVMDSYPMSKQVD